MSRSRGRGRWGRLAGDEQAVSVVVGGVLMAALVVITLVTVQVVYVPVWEEDSEAERMRDVQGEFASLKGEVDRQVGNLSQAPVASTITMSSGKPSSIFGTAGLPSTLTFEGDDKPFVVGSDLFLIQSENGRRLLGADEEWLDVNQSTLVDDVASVDSLRIRIPDASTKLDDEFVLATLTDANGDFAGNVTATVINDPPELIYFITVHDDAGEVLYAQGFTYHQVQGQDTFYIDLMDEQLRFDKLLAAADAPLEITFTEDANTDAEYAISYATDAGGPVIIGGGGREVVDFLRTHRGGTLILDAPNHRFVSQTYILESGAVILRQGDDTVFRVEPHFVVGTTAGYLTVEMTVPTLVGDGVAISGGGSAKVLTTSGSPHSVAGLAPSLTLDVTTDYPSLWAAFWTGELEDAGYSEAAGHFAVATTNATATLTLYGPTTDPASTAYDISLNLHQAQVNVQLLS